MNLNDLKTGFWGFKKDVVFQYISSIETDASARLAEKATQLAQVEERARLRIAELERSLREAYEEIERLNGLQKKDADAVSGTNTQSGVLQEDMVDPWSEQSTDVMVHAQAIRDNVLKYGSQLDTLQQTLRTMLEVVDEQAHRIELTIDPESAKTAELSPISQIRNNGYSNGQREYPFDGIQFSTAASGSTGNHTAETDEPRPGKVYPFEHLRNEPELPNSQENNHPEGEV